MITRLARAFIQSSKLIQNTERRMSAIKTGQLVIKIGKNLLIERGVNGSKIPSFCADSEGWRAAANEWMKNQCLEGKVLGIMGLRFDSSKEVTNLECIFYAEASKNPSQQRFYLVPPDSSDISHLKVPLGPVYSLQMLRQNHKQEEAPDSQRELIIRDSIL